ncbi:MAG TPA: serine/threonine-protein kinase, partial [Polyangiaceae bacterium]|nr:serine/threonine-protein kinase [Polyangiaceae bacterium]
MGENLADAPLGSTGLPLAEVGAKHVLGRYDLLMPLASGGMAMVWAARLRGSRGFQKIVAIKTMLPKLSDDEHFEQMFLDEAALASQVRHPHVVEILDLGEQDDVLFLVMEWIEGVALHELLKTARKSGGVPLNVAVRIVSQALAGLHAAHELQDPSGQLVGLVHRDISPQNILVTYDGVAKVVDFGVAKATAMGDGTTAAGKIKGKAAYMAPEQIRDEHIDRRIDVFAMGIVLYAITTGRHPFRKESEGATLYNICSPKPPAPPRKIIPGYPASLERVVLQALAKDPAKRFATANDMLRALDHALPASMRLSTDEEVASFVRGLFSERREKQKAAIQAALLAADDRAASGVSLRRLLDSKPPPPPTGSTSDLSSAGPLSASGPRSALSSDEQSWPERSAPELSSPGVPANLGLTTGAFSAQEDPPEIPRRRGRGGVVFGVLLLLAGMLAAGVYLWRTREPAPVADAPPAETARPAAVATASPPI